MEAESQTLEKTSAAFSDALRLQAVTAMAQRLAEKNFPEMPWETMGRGLKQGLIDNQLIAFNALYGIVRVNAIKATEEMARAGLAHRQRSQGGLAETFDIMSEAGDLTKPD